MNDRGLAMLLETLREFQPQIRLVLVKVFLDLLRIAGLRQGQLQQHTSLLRVQVLTGHETVLSVIDFSILGGRASRDAGRTHNNDTVLSSLFEDREQVLVDVAVTDTSRHNTLVTGLQQSLKRFSRNVGVVINDTDLRQRRQLRQTGSSWCGALRAYCRNAPWS